MHYMENNEPTLIINDDNNTMVSLNDIPVADNTDNTLYVIGGAVGVVVAYIYIHIKYVQPILQSAIADNIRNGYYAENEHYNRYHHRHPLHRFV